MSNTFTKFIDSCVGAIARKVQDEFDENKHPRDKGGKFASKGNEGRGGGASELEETDFEKEAKKELGNGKESDSDSADGDDADVVPSLERYKENVRENFDGDEEYEVEARYDRAKFHSDKFKKLKNGEYRGTPEEKYLKNYCRRLGMKKPEDAFKVWWDI